MNKNAGCFRIHKTYLQKIMKQQANYVVADENGDIVASKNPIQGISPSTTVEQIKPKASGFRMHKTFYTVADR
jgi:hypothetical protein